MPTATTNNTTWTETSEPPQTGSFTIRQCYLARPGRTIVPLELALFAVALVQITLGHANTWALLIPVSCAFIFHVMLPGKKAKPSPQAPLPRNDTVFELYFAFLTFAALACLFPARAGVEAAVAGSLLAGAAPLALRPLWRFIDVQRKAAEGILILGNGEVAQKLYRALCNNTSSRPELPKGVLAFPGEREDRGLQIDFLRLDEIVKDDGITRIVVAEEDPRLRARLSSALVDLRLRGLKVTDAVDFYEQSFGKIWVEALSSEWFVYTSGFHHSRASVAFKRFIDIVSALILLVLTAPLMVVIAIAIKLDSRGPAMFRQFRVGLFGKPFVIYKFRSMRQNAEAKGGPAWASQNDCRTTRIGAFLRKYRLDELPQVFNVLLGDMSMVGPRPERPCFLDKLTDAVPFYELRHYAKPGITGWAQVKYRYGATVDDAHQKLEYDIYYAKHRSFVCDLKILFQTVGIVLLGKGQ
jgi:sugar transferase (PEP-CTERM system associated)